MPAFLNELLEKHSGQRVLLITHGGVIKGTMSLLEKRELSDISWDEIPNAVALNFDMTDKL